MKRHLFVLIVAGVFIFSSFASAADSLPDSNLSQDQLHRLPRVVVPTFSSMGEGDKDEALAVALTELLTIALGKNEKLYLIDHQFMDILAGASLTAPEDLDQAIRAMDPNQRRLTSDTTITGCLLPSEDGPTVVIRSVDSVSSILKDIKEFKIDAKNPEITAEQLGQFVQSSLERPLEREKDLWVSIGGFEDKSDTDAFLSKGDSLRAFLEERYALHPAVGVVARSQIESLIAERMLLKMENTNISERLKSVQQESLMIDGRYAVETGANQSFVLNLRIERVGEFEKWFTLKSSTWDGLLKLVMETIDDWIGMRHIKPTDEKRKEAEVSFEKGMALVVDPSARSYSLAGITSQILFPENSEEKLRDAIDYFEKAILLYPSYESAMFFQAICCLHERIKKEHQANSLLGHILMSSKDMDLRQEARRQLVDGTATIDAFDGIVANSRSLYQALIEHGYIGDGGAVYYKFLDIKDPEDLTETLFQDKKYEIYSVLKEATCHAEWSDKATGLRDDPPWKHAQKAMSLSRVTFNKAHFFSKLDTTSIGGKGSPEHKIKNIRDAADAFASAAFMESENQEAMILMALCLKQAGKKDLSIADMILGMIIEKPTDEDAKLMAAEALDVLDKVSFSPYFSKELCLYGYIRERKYALLIDLIAQHTKSPSTISKKQVLDAYAISIAADCNQLICSAKNFDYDCFQSFILLSESARSDKTYADVRDQILENILKKYPQLWPHFAISRKKSTPGWSHYYGMINLQLEALHKIELKEILPLYPEEFDRELGDLFEDIVDSYQIEAGIKMGEFLQKYGGLTNREAAYLASAYLQVGKPDKALRLLETILYGKVTLAANALNVLADNNGKQAMMILRATDTISNWIPKLEPFFKPHLARSFSSPDYNRPIETAISNTLTLTSSDKGEAKDPDKSDSQIVYTLKKTDTNDTPPIATPNADLFLKKIELMMSASTSKNQAATALVADKYLFASERDIQFADAVAMDHAHSVVGAHFRGEKGMCIIFKLNEGHWIYEQTIRNPDDMERNDYGNLINDVSWFGKSVAVSGNHIAVGVPLDDQRVPLRSSDFSKEFSLTVGDMGKLMERLYLLGYLDGENRVVSQSQNHPEQFMEDFKEFNSSEQEYIWGMLYKYKQQMADTGSVMIFKHDGAQWVRQTVLTASDAVKYGRFGTCVAVDGDYAIVCALGAEDTVEDSDKVRMKKGEGGGAYVFHREGDVWKQETKLTADPCNEVSMHGEYAILQTISQKEGLCNARIYKREGRIWIEEAKFQEKKNKIVQKGAVAIWENSAMVCQGDSVLILKKDNGQWLEKKKIPVDISDGYKSSRPQNFLIRVAISRDYALVKDLKSVSIYKNEASGWKLGRKITGPSEEFFSIAVNENNCIIGLKGRNEVNDKAFGDGAFFIHLENGF